MLKFLSNLINLNAALASQVKGRMLFDEASALYKEKEYAKAAPLMSEASKLGNPQAMSILGTMYLFGHGVKEDGQAAVRCLEAAIEAGFDDAWSVLGMALATGKAGVKIDIQRAVEILERCAAKGDTQSAKMLVMIEKGEGMFRRYKKSRKNG